ncbi:MAG: hypothetical protein ACOZAA_05105 [Pseudomonadota bacterium]
MTEAAAKRSNQQKNDVDRVDKMQLIITDLTEMSSGSFCVAGWDTQAQRMIRPLPNDANWTQGQLNQFGITPGATVQFQVSNQPHASAYPHHTEDTRVDAANVALVNAGPINWFAHGAPPNAPSLNAGFGGQLLYNSIWNGARQGSHIAVGTQVPSLCGVLVLSQNLDFIEEFGRLKALLNDGQNSYKLAVSSRTLKNAWRNGGLVAATQALPQTAQFHVRVGLARAFGNPADKCYVMVNGVHG